MPHRHSKRARTRSTLRGHSIVQTLALVSTCAIVGMSGLTMLGSSVGDSIAEPSAGATPSLTSRASAGAGLGTFGRFAVLDAYQMRRLGFSDAQASAMLDAQRHGFEIQVLARHRDGGFEQVVLFGDNPHNTRDAFASGLRVADAFPLRGFGPLVQDALTDKTFGLGKLFTRIFKPRHREGSVTDAVRWAQRALAETDEDGGHVVDLLAGHRASVDEELAPAAYSASAALAGAGLFVRYLEARGMVPAGALDEALMVGPAALQALPMMAPARLETSRWGKALFPRFGNVRNPNITVSRNIVEALARTERGPGVTQNGALQMLVMASKDHIPGLIERLEDEGFVQRAELFASETNDALIWPE